MVGSTTLHAAGARAPRDTPSSSKRRVAGLDLGNFSFPKGLIEIEEEKIFPNINR
jgi:hypothetical protein